MAIVAPLSKFKKTNLLIYIAACVLVAVVFGYDGGPRSKTPAENRASRLLGAQDNSTTEGPEVV